MNILWNKIRKEVNTSEPKVKKDGKQKKKKLVNMYSTPTMVFSVIGNSDSFVPRPWPTTLFQTALIEAAKSGGGIDFFEWCIERHLVVCFFFFVQQVVLNTSSNIHPLNIQRSAYLGLFLKSKHNEYRSFFLIKKKPEWWCVHIYSLVVNFFVETWILFRKNDEGLSNVIRNAYQHYEAMEFGKKQKDIGDPERHIKLINIAGKEVFVVISV